MNQKIAARLVEYRLTAGLSQEKLAEKLNVSRQAVSKWERGESLPDIGNIIALADLYGVTVDELLRGKTVGEVAVVADKGAVAAGDDGESSGNAKAASTGDAAETQNPSSENEAYAQETSMEGECGFSDNAEASHGLEREEAKPSCKKRRTWPKVVALTVCGLMVVSLISIVMYLMPVASSTELPFAKEMSGYKPSAGFPWDKLSDEDYTAEGEGSCTVSGYISALYLDWPEGKVSIRAVGNEETQGAMVVRDKTTGTDTPVRWRQEGGQLVVFQERDESGLPVGSSLPEALKPDVEILVPQSINLLDLLQMRVESAEVEVSGLHISRLKLQQDAGDIVFFQNDVMQSNVEVNGGTLSMKGSSNRSMDLLQRGGTSIISFQGAAPPTMDVVVEGGDAAVLFGADEGCQVKLDQSGDGVFDFAFDSAMQSDNIYNAGNMETFINAKLSGGYLSVGARGLGV